MKQALFIIISIMMSTTIYAQNIDKEVDYKDGRVAITSAEQLFSGCKMRLCRYQAKSGGPITYGLELDLTDRVHHVCKGNMLTIHFADGDRISLTNLYDTQAIETHESHIETYDHLRTNFVPVYDAWYGAFYSVPVTRNYRETVPVVTTTTFAELFYIITPQQMEKIINSKVKSVSIVTDEETIVKKARPLSRAMSYLYPIILK